MLLDISSAYLQHPMSTSFWYMAAIVISTEIMTRSLGGKAFQNCPEVNNA